MNEHNMTAPEVVQKIRDEIFQDTQLTASAGNNNIKADNIHLSGD